MALGASSSLVQRGVILQTLRLSAIGVALGLAVSWVMARSLTGLLFGVTATDPLTFFGMPVVLAAVAVLAGYLPARRAARIDPLQALRAE